MILETAIANYLVLDDDPVEVALRQLNINQSRTVFVVSHDGTLVGSLTDGDFRRWILESTGHTLASSCGDVANKACQFLRRESLSENVDNLFSPKILLLPIVDERLRVVAIGRPRSSAFAINGTQLSGEDPVFVIAEIGINHNGNLETAKQLIDSAHQAGANAVKFQMRDMETLYRSGQSANASEDLGVEYTLDLLSQSFLPTEQLIQMFDYALKLNLTSICTPWDEESVRVLQEYGISGFKIASADLTNHPLLSLIASTGTPVLLSTGMSSESEIIDAASVLKTGVSPFALLHCNSTYPAPFRDIRLDYMSRLREIGNCLVGYSGHERGHHVVIAAVAQGAKIIEKHITMDRTAIGNDHKVSLEPAEFAQMVSDIREVEASLRNEGPREVTQGERMNRLTLAKSLVAKHDLPKGHVVTADDIEIRSPGRGIQPNALPRLLGVTLHRNVDRADFFYETDITPPTIVPRHYSFQRPWGLPVRFHDYAELSQLSNPDFLEFHLSYKDMEINFEDRLSTPWSAGLIVHSPDLFLNDHILDLASEDEGIFNASVHEVQRVIDFTRRLKHYFGTTEIPKVVVSMGGSSLDAPLPVSKRHAGYERIAKSIQAMDTSGVELLAQTLPPFPWYLGGQRYCNLFVDPIEIANFATEFGIGICLDISHTKLACNYLRMSFGDAIETIAPHSRHLHLVDAIGVNNEGVQIGEGDVDWSSLCSQLNKLIPEASFIPEIWQGHVDSGQGFWIALNRLEKLLNA
jgi:N-acetylneuraminate synthase